MSCQGWKWWIARCMRRNRGRSRLMVTSMIRGNGHSTWSTNYLLWALVMEIKALSFVFHFLPRTRQASRCWLSILFLGTRIWETSCGPVSWPQLLPCRVLARISWSWWSRLKMRGTHPESWCNEKVCYHTRWACTAFGWDTTGISKTWRRMLVQVASRCGCHMLLVWSWVAQQSCCSG